MKNSIMLQCDIESQPEGVKSQDLIHAPATQLTKGFVGSELPEFWRKPMQTKIWKPRYRNQDMEPRY